MYNNLQYQRQIAADRQEILRRQAGVSRLRRNWHRQRPRARSSPPH